MAKLGVTEFIRTNDELFAGTFPRREKEITIVAGQNLVRGTVLGKITASGKYKAYSNASADGSETAVGILGAAIDASAGDRAAFMYETGDFDQDALTGFDEAARPEMETRNIYVIKKVR